jgi:hypothetical protein
VLILSNENNELNFMQEKKENFKTIDITKYTPKERVLSMNKNPQRPGEVCKMSACLIHDDEVEEIANKLDLTKDQLTKNLLDKIHVYGKIIHKPKLEKKDGKEHLPIGTCVFFNESKCKLEDKMPLHCKLSTADSHGHKLHLWYMLNHVIDKSNPDAIREWNVYLKTHPTIPGGELHELVPEKTKLEKILSYDHLVEKKDDDIKN